MITNIQSWSRDFDFKKYSYLINRAELSIVDAEHSQALTYFDSAFALKKKPFAIDLFNASICAIKGRQIELALNYCEMLANKGVEAAFFFVMPHTLG